LNPLHLSAVVIHKTSHFKPRTYKISKVCSLTQPVRSHLQGLDPLRSQVQTPAATTTTKGAISHSPQADHPLPRLPREHQSQSPAAPLPVSRLVGPFLPRASNAPCRVSLEDQIHKPGTTMFLQNQQHRRSYLRRLSHRLMVSRGLRLVVASP
jgi:hypothetical protein